MGDEVEIARKHVTEEFLKVRPRLLIYALSLTRDQDRAADLVQDTLVQAVEKATYYEIGTNFRAWSFRMMRNLFISAGRRPMNQAHADVTEMVIPQPARQEDGMRTRLLFHYLKLLPKDTRKILLLAALEEMPYEAIGELLGIEVGSVKSRISRARDLLDGAL